MEIFNYLGIIIRNICSPSYVTLMLAGAALGIVFGAIPGLNSTIALTICIPFTFKMNAPLAIAFLMCVYIGGVSGGFISATLVGIPGTNASIATCYDAYPLSQKGETIRALGTGMLGSFLGTFFGMIVAVFACGPIARIALKLGPWEYFSLCFCAVSLIIALSGENIFKGLAGAFFGMLLGTVGISPIDASFRFTFHCYNLYGGINMVALMLGMFAVRMIAVNFACGEQKMPDMTSAKMHGLGIKLKDITSNLFNIFRSFWLGVFIGFLPGLGGNVSNLVAYGQAKKSSKHPEEFGKGCVDGIWASEVSNNSTIGGALIPMLTLGVPGDGQCAILMGALMLQGIETGPLLLSNEPVLAYTVFIGGSFAAIYTLVMQYLGMQVFPRILHAPYHYLYGTIIFICLAGSFATTNAVFNCGTTIFFGIVSLLLCYLKIPVSPTVLGFVIGPLIEKNLRKALTYSKNGPIEFLTRPVSALFLILAVVLIVTGVISYRKKKAVSGMERGYDAEK